MKITIGTRHDDSLRALDVDETIRALQGDDTVVSHRDDGYDLTSKLIYLNAGNDDARGFDYADTVYGGLGDDTIVGSSWPEGGGNFYGGPGNDLLTSSWGAQLFGGRGNDTLMVGSADDAVVRGGRGHDTYKIYGYYGDFELTDRDGRSDIYLYFDGFNGTIITGDRSDTITVIGELAFNCVIRSGDRGDIIRSDGIIFAGRGHDEAVGRVVYGGRGNDTLTGNVVYGNTGNDEIIIHDDDHGSVSGPIPMIAYGGWGDDTMTAVTDSRFAESEAYGGQGDDLIKFFKLAYGGAGDDVIIDSGTVYGEDGNDRLLGHVVYGQLGDDTVEGSRLQPGDTFRDGEDANDQLFGGAGADKLRFALYRGDDEMTGGEGADVFILTEFSPETSADLITTADLIMDFTFGLDRINLSVREGVDAFSDLTLEPVGTDTAIKDSEGFVLVVVKDTSPDAFSADDFIFT